MFNKSNTINKIDTKQVITLTKKAAQQIIFLINQNSNNKGIRLNIKKSGCAGFRYIMELVKNKKQEDIEFFQHGATIFISIKLLKFLKGIKIDFINHGLNQVFQFQHPNTQHYCGCGESFEIKDKNILIKK
ncbi:MAG TPA: iron-sulfur cluster assembly accessory protein [Buchnera sp. (in: enterobacteria)]|nr:iron-sulfur cluster assembly accessory protein [Buchnera sp. (in: enterobacteria)]